MTLSLNKKICILYIAVMVMLMRSSATLREVFLLNDAMILLEIVVFIYFGIKCCAYQKKSKFLITFLTYYFFLLLSTVMGSQDYKAFFVYTVQAVGTVFIVEYGIRKEKLLLIKVIRNCLAVLAIMNLVSLLLFPDGFSFIGETGYYILGIRIGFSPFIILLLMVVLIYDRLSFGKYITKKGTVILIVGFLNLALQQVQTGVFTFIGILFLLFYLQRQRIKLLTFHKFIIVFFAVFVSIVFFSAQYHIPFFTELLVDVMGKDLSFNNRQFIWAASIRDIIQKPVWGYGMTTGGDVFVPFEYTSRIVTSHNQILHVLHEGGLISFSLFMYMFALIGKKISYYRHNYIVQIVFATIIGFFLMMLTEVQSQKALIFFLMALAYHVDKLIEIDKGVNRKDTKG